MIIKRNKQKAVQQPRTCNVKGLKLRKVNGEAYDASYLDTPNGNQKHSHSLMRKIRKKIVSSLKSLTKTIFKPSKDTLCVILMDDSNDKDPANKTPAYQKMLSKFDLDDCARLYSIKNLQDPTLKNNLANITEESSLLSSKHNPCPIDTAATQVALNKRVRGEGKRNPRDHRPHNKDRVDSQNGSAYSVLGIPVAKNYEEFLEYDSPEDDYSTNESAIYEDGYLNHLYDFIEVHRHNNIHTIPSPISSIHKEKSLSEDVLNSFNSNFAKLKVFPFQRAVSTSAVELNVYSEEGSNFHNASRRLYGYPLRNIFSTAATTLADVKHVLKQVTGLNYNNELRYPFEKVDIQAKKEGFISTSQEQNELPCSNQHQHNTSYHRYFPPQKSELLLGPLVYSESSTLSKTIKEFGDLSKSTQLQGEIFFIGNEDTYINTPSTLYTPEIKGSSHPQKLGKNESHLPFTTSTLRRCSAYSDLWANPSPDSENIMQNFLADSHNIPSSEVTPAYIPTLSQQRYVKVTIRPTKHSESIKLSSTIHNAVEVKFPSMPKKFNRIKKCLLSALAHKKRNNINTADGKVYMYNEANYDYMELPSNSTKGIVNESFPSEPNFSINISEQLSPSEMVSSVKVPSNKLIKDSCNATGHKIGQIFQNIEKNDEQYLLPSATNDAKVSVASSAIGKFYPHSHPYEVQEVKKRNLKLFASNYTIRGRLNSSQCTQVNKVIDKTTRKCMVAKSISINKSWTIYVNKETNRPIPLEIIMNRTFSGHPSFLNFEGYYDLVDEYILLIEYMGNDWVDLFTYIDKRGPKDALEARYITRGIMEGIKYMHSCCIAHNDIKDENVLINLKTLKTKIIDLGSAARIENSYCGRFKGTDKYACPRYFTGEGYTDMQQESWAFGCLVFVLCFRSDPYSGCEDIVNVDINDVIDNHIRRIQPVYKYFQLDYYDLLEIIVGLMDYNPRRRILVSDIHLPDRPLHSSKPSPVFDHIYEHYSNNTANNTLMVK